MGILKFVTILPFASCFERFLTHDPVQIIVFIYCHPLERLEKLIYKFKFNSKKMNVFSQINSILENTSQSINSVLHDPLTIKMISFSYTKRNVNYTPKHH